jgi:glycosyltransferase involved in cell wall biosynthesis
MKILLNLPDYRHIHGGVTNHYVGLRPFWKEDIRYNIIGKRREGYSGIWWLPYDYTKFLFKLLMGRYDGVVINPSFNHKAWTRDRVFMKIARAVHIPVAIMFHGWTAEYVASLPKARLVADLNQASVILVLAGQFRQQLLDLGVTAPIELTTTKVADSLLDGFDISTRKGAMRKFLFLCRLVKEKGLYETLELFKLIKQDYPDATLTVAGDGAEYKPAQQYVADHQIDGVNFTGHIEGEEIARVYRESDCYLFPTYYGEGMPTSLLEAMSFGLPSLTAPVGGTADFFEDGKMGVLTKSRNPEELYSLLKPYFDNPEKVAEISRYNYEYACRRFKASAVANSMEKILQKYLLRK